MPTPPSSRSRYRRGVPATNIIARPVGNSTSAEPRSGSFKIRTNGSSIMPMAFQNVCSDAQFLDGPAQEMGQGEDERELGELRGLQAEEAEVKPAPRPKPHRAERTNTATSSSTAAQ